MKKLLRCKIIDRGIDEVNNVKLTIKANLPNDFIRYEISYQIQEDVVAMMFDGKLVDSHTIGKHIFEIYETIDHTFITLEGIISHHFFRPKTIRYVYRSLYKDIDELCKYLYQHKGFDKRYKQYYTHLSKKGFPIVHLKEVGAHYKLSAATVNPHYIYRTSSHQLPDRIVFGTLLCSYCSNIPFLTSPGDSYYYHKYDVFCLPSGRYILVISRKGKNLSSWFNQHEYFDHIPFYNRSDFEEHVRQLAGMQRDCVAFLESQGFNVA